MKASSRPEPLYTFRYPNLGYSILNDAYQAASSHYRVHA